MSAWGIGVSSGTAVKFVGVSGTGKYKAVAPFEASNVSTFSPLCELKLSITTTSPFFNTGNKCRFKYLYCIIYFSSFRYGFFYPQMTQMFTDKIPKQSINICVPL